MKPFNLKTYLENPSREVFMIGDSSIPVRIICTDAKGEYPVIALVTLDATTECPFRYTEDGLSNKGKKGQSDLYFKSVKKSGWVNIYTSKFMTGQTITGSICKTKDEALSIAAGKDNYLDTIYIEWEE